jgi:hypothetical protein
MYLCIYVFILFNYYMILKGDYGTARVIDENHQNKNLTTSGTTFILFIN